jgi:protein-S-isoprenylcysteine O-methyltransferase Ste14
MATRAVTSSTLAVGQKLFRLRSLTPVPVIAVCAWLLWTAQGQPGPGGASVDLALDVVGLLLACTGQAMRFYVLGWVPEGTSGQNLSIQASTLNTTGPYAYVRNPLYVGNLGIVLGLCLMAHVPLVYPVVLGFFFGEYHFIIRAEEAFLRSKFGAAFDDFFATVPRWVPRLTPARQGALRAGTFDWRRALKKEINPFSAWALGALALVGWQQHSRGGLAPEVLGALVSVAAMVVVSLLVIKAWKKGWLFS